MKASQMKKIKNLISQSPLKAQKARKNKKALTRVMMKEKRICQQVENVLISSVPPRRYTKRSDPEYNKINTASFAKTVMKTTTTISIVNFVNKFIQILVKTKTMTNGLVVITVSVG